VDEAVLLRQFGAIGHADDDPARFDGFEPRAKSGHRRLARERGTHPICESRVGRGRLRHRQMHLTFT